MDNPSKNHHFVPRSLLRKFSSDSEKKKIFVFDKLTLKSFQNSISKTGSENHFHTIKGDGINFNFENYFDIPDRSLGSIIPKILKKESLEFLTKDERETIFILTSLQLVRTRGFRNKFMSLTKSVSETIFKITQKMRVPKENISPPLGVLGEEESKLLFLTMGKQIQNFADILKEKVVTLAKTNDSNPFWCSDNPICFNNFLPGGDFGLASRGTEVFFPISKNFTIIFSCKSLLYQNVPFQKALDLRKNEKNFINFVNFKAVRNFEKDNVTYLNSLQVRNSNRFIYSNLNEFSLALKFLNEFPQYINNDDKAQFSVNNNSNSWQYDSMPDGKYLVINGKHENHMISIESYNLENLTFKTHELNKLQRIIADNPLIEVKLIVDKELKIQLKNMQAECFKEPPGKLKLNYKNPIIPQMLKDLKEQNSAPKNE